MKFHSSLSKFALCGVAVGVMASVNAQEVFMDGSQFTATQDAPAVQKSESGLYIIQLKGASGVDKAIEIGELTPSNKLQSKAGNRYNGRSAKMQGYINAMKQRQQEVANEIGDIDVLHNYVHTYNGFSAKLTPAQVAALRSHPDVAAVYADELYQPATSNTPAFLGLTGSGGQHSLGIKGEDVIVGILDTGIWPENPSFGDDGSYSDPADIGWNGACDAGEEAGAGEAGTDTFQCNNKLIGARYYPEGFSAAYQIRTELGEFMSPRDADGHGSHTAGTAAGNENVAAELSGVDVGTISGIAPRARIAAYKVCWNSSYVSPEGNNERGCFFGDSMAAIDDAIADGVDVLNYSIGNSTSLNTPVYNASLRAQQAGVFFAASGGNSGPGPETISNIAPWITTVAASTYDGTSAVIGTALDYSVDGEAQDPLLSVPGSITTDIPAEGLTGDLVAAEPALACDPITNPEAINGNVALIARGTCNFSIKVLNAQEAGASSVVVYSDSRSPIAMGGDGTGITIPGVMISNEDGLALDALLAEGSAVSVTFTNDGVAAERTEVGNVMAGFSSRGANPQSADIIKPDITAPGVQILAAGSFAEMDIPGNVQGENFKYLSGTSMSGPHVAGMAALLMGQHPEWTPAQVKSALMTTSYQNVVKEDGATPADPFDFGAGHANPVPAMDPGLTYNLNVGDYLGFICGQGEDAMVANFTTSSCADIEAAGFATDASQLNYPSIAIGEFGDSESITRTVTDVTGTGGEYTVSVDAPAGINVSVRTFDSEGVETESDTLVVPANGSASYELTFVRTEAVTPLEWVFGSVTLDDGAGHTVRSPIAINPQPIAKIAVPESLSLQLNRGRATFPVQMLYSGATSIEHAGLSAPLGALQGQTFRSSTFNFGAQVQAGSYHLMAMPEGTKVARFSLRDGLIGSEAPTDLDIYVYSCLAFSCTPVASSTNDGSAEDVILVNPEPRSGAGGNVYFIAVHGRDTGDADTVNYAMPVWYVSDAESTTRVLSSRRAIEGRFNNISILTRGLDPNSLYMGAITFFDDQGEAQGTTVLEVQP